MRERAAVLVAVARDGALARLELAYFGFNMAEFGTWMAILVYAYAIGGAATAAVFALVQLVPAGVIAPVAAGMADRTRHDRALLAGYAFQAVALGATAVALGIGADPWLTLAAATMASISFGLTRPIQSAILPSLTHSPADLIAANAASALAENVGIFLGPLLAGLLLADGEPWQVFGMFAVISAVGAVLVARLPAAAQVRHDGGRDSEASGAVAALREWFGGFDVLAANRALLMVVVIVSAATVVIGALDILFVATAIDLLALDESWAGFLYAAFGLGGIAGAATTVLLIGRRRMTPALAASGGVFGLPISAIGVVASPLAAPLLFAASGAGYSVVTVAGRTLLQRIAPEAALARVFGILEGLSMFALAIGSVLAGVLIATVGAAWALVLGGLLVPAVLVSAWVRLRALDRDARAPDPEALALLRALPMFAPLSALTIDRILAELERVQVPPGRELIRQGDHGDRYYVIASGRVQIIRDGVAVREQGAGEGFGEIALIRDVPRTASVVALTAVELITIERERFLEAITGHPQSHASAEAVAAARS
jgi:MFS family permease